MERKRGEIVEGHFCWGCLPSVDKATRSKNNPAKTAFCLKCNHRSEGIESKARVGDWLMLIPTRFHT